MTDNSKGRLALIAFLALALLAYLWAAPLRDLYGLEARNALMAREMLEGGMTFIPHTYGRPYLDYLPLYFWLETLFSLPFGQVTTLSAILPSTLAAVGLLAVGYRLGCEAGARIGWMTVLILATMPGFWLDATQATIDMLLAVNVAAALLCLYLKEREGEGRRRWRYALGASLFVLLAFLTKGPLGLVLPAGIWSGYLLFAGRWRALARFVFFMTVLAAAGVALEVALYWWQGGEELVRAFIRSQVTSRVGEEANRPSYYYLLYLLRSTAPWWLWSLPLLRRGLQKPVPGRAVTELRRLLSSGSPAALCLVWVFATLTLFSLASCRHGRYLLPLYPPLAVLLALAVEKARRAPSRFGEKAFDGFFALLLIGVWGAVLGLTQLRPVPWPWVAAWSGVALLGRFFIRRAAAREWGAAPLVALLLAMGLSAAGFLVEPLISRRESARALAGEAESGVDPAVPIALYRVPPDGDGVKYALYSRRRPADLLFVGAPQEVLQLPRPSLVIASRKDWEYIEAALPPSLSVKEVAEGLIHRRPLVARLLTTAAVADK